MTDDAPEFIIEDVEEFCRMQAHLAAKLNVCLYCDLPIAQDDLGEWFDTWNDRSCTAADEVGAGLEHVPLGAEPTIEKRIEWT